jgi:hypothetical protein
MRLEAGGGGKKYGSEFIYQMGNNNYMFVEQENIFGEYK